VTVKPRTQSDIDVYGCDSFADVAFQRGAELRQMQVAVDPPNLLGGFDHAGGAPAADPTVPNSGDHEHLQRGTVRGNAGSTQAAKQAP
jgi:hypothetical protein